MGQTRDGGRCVEESLGPMRFRKQEERVRTPGLYINALLLLSLGLRLRTQ